MPTPLHSPLHIPQARRVALERIAAELTPGRTAVLSTHINADGDGCGSEAALALMLAQRGITARIVNPTAWPPGFAFLLEGVTDRSADGARALYTAMLTDTGGFRFSNTSPRCHAVAAQLLAAGVDPEEMYRRIYAQMSVGRLKLLRDALDSLEVDAPHGISWITLPAGVLEKYDVRSEELDGFSEHPRSVAGTKLALFFRDLGHGQVKVSFRSTGGVDVNRFARQFGGGGHAKAAGALISGSLGEVRDKVIAAAQRYLAPLPADHAARAAT